MSLKIIENDKVKEVLKWLSESNNSYPFDVQYQNATRDIFQARLNNLYSESQNPLLVAVVGELGNNSFDHNLGNWRDIPGLFFRNYTGEKENSIILADRGQGVKVTLQKVDSNIGSDIEAVTIAFTKIISGRDPEHRGNGLKFVASIVKRNDWELYFQSGKGAASIAKKEINFFEANNYVYGCFAALNIKKG